MVNKTLREPDRRLPRSSTAILLDYRGDADCCSCACLWASSSRSRELSWRRNLAQRGKAVGVGRPGTRSFSSIQPRQANCGAVVGAIAVAAATAVDEEGDQCA